MNRGRVIHPAVICPRSARRFRASDPRRSRPKSRTTSRRWRGQFCSHLRDWTSRGRLSAAAANTLDLAIDLLVLLIYLGVPAPLRARYGRPRPRRSRRTGRHTAAGVDAGPRRLRGASAVGAGRCRRRAPGRVRRAAWIFAGIVQSAWRRGSGRDTANALRAGTGGSCARRAGGAAAAAAGR
jgi:hypothetical protein